MKCIQLNLESLSGKVESKGASEPRNHSVKAIKQRGCYMLLISTAGLIQATEKFSSKKYSDV
jgi:hypothetical protein